MSTWVITAGKRLSRGCRLRADRRGNIVVVPEQRTMSRGAMHILETHKGFILADYTVVRCKSNGIWQSEVHHHVPAREKYFAFR